MSTINRVGESKVYHSGHLHSCPLQRKEAATIDYQYNKLRNNFYEDLNSLHKPKFSANFAREQPKVAQKPWQQVKKSQKPQV